MKSKVLSIVVLLLAVALFGLLFVNHRQEQRQTAYMQQLQKEAVPYKQEINDIRSELAQKQHAINTKEDASGILFGLFRRLISSLGKKLSILPRLINWLQNIPSPR